MKILLTLLLILFTSLAPAANLDLRCGVVLPYPVGGLPDVYTRAMERLNSDIYMVDHKPGALGTLAMIHMAQHPNFTMLASPMMFGETNPNKNIQVELIRFIIGYDILMVTNSGITLQQILTQKINIGITSIGSPMHIVALQLKELNPLIEIIPTGGDSKTLTLLLDKSLDVYISGSYNLSKWITSYKIQPILTVPSGGSFKKDKIVLNNYSAVGMWRHRDAPPEVKLMLDKCINTVVISPTWPAEINAMGASPMNLNTEESGKMLNEYITILRKYGL